MQNIINNIIVGAIICVLFYIGHQLYILYENVKLLELEIYL